jgi:hypothetical protein
MNAEYVSRSLPATPVARTGSAARWTLELVVAGACLTAFAQLSVLREYPGIESPDTVALLSFGRALLQQLPDDAAFSHSDVAAFDLRPKSTFAEPAP